MNRVGRLALAVVLLTSSVLVYSGGRMAEPADALVFPPVPTPLPTTAIPLLAPAGAATVTVGGAAAEAGLLATSVSAGGVAAATVGAALVGYATGRYALGPAMCKGALGGVTDWLMPGTGGAEPCNPYEPPEWVAPEFTWAFSGNRYVLSYSALNFPGGSPAYVVGVVVGPEWGYRKPVTGTQFLSGGFGNVSSGFLGPGHGEFCTVNTYGYCGGQLKLATSVQPSSTSNGPFFPEDRIAVVGAYSYGCYGCNKNLAVVGDAMTADTAVGGWAPAPDVVRSRGRSFGFSVMSDCVPVAAPLGTSVTRSVTGAFGFESGSDVEVPPVPCLEGEISRRTTIQKIGPNRGGSVVDIGPAVVTDLDVEHLPPECLAVGNTCGDPVILPEVAGQPRECVWGSVQLVLSSCTPPETRVLTDPWIPGEKQPQPEQPSPSTTTATATVPPSPSTTLAPPADPENCVGAFCVGGPGGSEPDSEGGECWPGGWGWFNPVEWVLRPVKCALVWAFWDADSAAEIRSLATDTGWPEAVQASSFTTSSAAGPCVDMDVAEICTSAVLGVEVPAEARFLLSALIAMWGLFEVIGLFSRVTRT